MDNMDIWKKFDKPPKEMLKTIAGGRLGGMTDIKPQWRYQVMTEVFGPCGVGWTYDILNTQVYDGSEGQIVASVEIELFIKQDGEWSRGIPGLGGSMLVANESKGPHTNDEAFKMALTDALSYAMSKLGVAAEIYMGNWDGSKYKEQPKKEQTKPQSFIERCNHAKELYLKLRGGLEKLEEILMTYKAEKFEDIPKDQQEEFISDLQREYNKIK